MKPNPTWDVDSNEHTVNVFNALDDDYEFLIWCDDGCPDCQAQLPDFAAALQAANIDDSRITTFPVERLPEGRKRGPMVDEYGIQRIPTIVVERAGEEVARYVEIEDQPAASYLAGILEQYLPTNQNSSP